MLNSKPYVIYCHGGQLYDVYGCLQKAEELSIEMKELCDEVGFVYYLIIARLYDLDPKLNKNERTYAPIIFCRVTFNVNLNF